jgi:hypothetical protein
MAKATARANDSACTRTAGNRASQESLRSRSTILGAKISLAPPRQARTRKKQNSTPHFTLRSNRFSLREFAAENVKSPARQSFRSLDATSFLEPETGLDMWVQLAKKESLTAAKLQESMKHGRVTRIGAERGSGTTSAGVATWERLSRQFDLLMRQIGDLWKD